MSHTVIEQSPVGFYSGPEEDSDPTLLILSAPQEKRLAIQSAAQAAWIASAGRSEGLRSIAATLSQHRAQHDFRAAFVASNHEEASTILQAFTNGNAADWITNGRVFESDINAGAVWVFSGHGAQWYVRNQQDGSRMLIYVYKQGRHGERATSATRFSPDSTTPRLHSVSRAWILGNREIAKWRFFFRERNPSPNLS